MPSRKTLGLSAAALAIAGTLTAVYMNEVGNDKAQVRQSVQESFSNAVSANSEQFWVSVFRGHSQRDRQLVGAEAEKAGFALCGSYDWPAPPAGQASGISGFILGAALNGPGKHIAAFAFTDDPDYDHAFHSAGTGVIYGKPCP